MSVISALRRAAQTVTVVALAVLIIAPASAQQQPGNLNGGRDCQVVRTCNFTKGGTFRGCLSSYSCRTCELVSAKCSVGAARAACREMRCNWGG
jgi:hypothetical protein